MIPTIFVGYLSARYGVKILVQKFFVNKKNKKENEN